MGSAGPPRRPDRGPTFDEPMYDGLRDLAPVLALLPGVDHIPPDTVALLETSPRLIEAYMVGLNHEMSREWPWREFPADLRGSPFRQVRDVRGQPGTAEDLKDIPACRGSGATPSSACHLPRQHGEGQLVLLVRGPSCYGGSPLPRSTPPPPHPTATSTR